MNWIKSRSFVTDDNYIITEVLLQNPPSPIIYIPAPSTHNKSQPPKDTKKSLIPKAKKDEDFNEEINKAPAVEEKNISELVKRINQNEKLKKAQNGKAD